MTGSGQIRKSEKTLCGRWSKSQHQRFLKGLQKYGKNWIEVQKVVKTRNLTQIRSHAQKMFLNKEQNGLNESIDTQNSDQISYQDSSMEESEIQNISKNKKLQRPMCHKNRQNLIGQLIHMIQHQNKVEENHATQQQQHKNDKQLVLPTKYQLYEYLNSCKNPSHFMRCLTFNRDFFLNGGSFLDLCQIKESNRSNGSQL